MSERFNPAFILPTDRRIPLIREIYRRDSSISGEYFCLISFGDNTIIQQINDRWILSHRPPKNTVDPTRPYAFLLEKERTAEGQIEDVATVFLTNRECPFRCLMCDLWKNTTDRPVSKGVIPAQIRRALEEMKNTMRFPDNPLCHSERSEESPVFDNAQAEIFHCVQNGMQSHRNFAKHIKLYNSGNFFDAKAIPPADHAEIARLLSAFKTVIIENHPRLVNERCLEFRDRRAPQLEVAMGLETAHEGVLQKLNKRVTLADFERATRFLTENGIRVRAFILLRPPFMDEQEGIFWAKRSIDFAFDIGVECCAVIPTRAGNGALEALHKRGLFSEPRLDSLEQVLDYGIALNRGRVFADLWDLQRFSDCAVCFQKRAERLWQMNLSQQILPVVCCSCNSQVT